MAEPKNNLARNRSNTNYQMSNQLGKIPPQVMELEESVLGALMIESNALNQVIDVLRPETFYKTAHQEIYRAIFELFSESEPIDMLTVTQQLRKKGKLEMVGGPSQIMRLTANVNSAANIEYHSRIITEQAIKRELIAIASEIQKEAFEDSTDVFELLDSAEQKLFQISETNIRKNFSMMNTLVQQAIKEIESRKDLKDGLTGIPTGLTALDRITAGWQKSDLVILAARPGMGKCLGKGTKVLMYDGSLKKVEDIQVGDQLMGDDSTPRLVLSLARGIEKMYWIRQNKGIDYRVNESHILSLKRSRNEGKYQHGEVIDIPLKEYLEKSDKFKSNYKGFKVTVDFSEQYTSIDPYFLGLWLGDGITSDVRIATQDTEVINYLEEYAQEQSLSLKVYQATGISPMYAITKNKENSSGSALQSELRKLNLLGNKHIPQNYLANSENKRLALLAGLLDSDGYYAPDSNGYEITLKDQALAQQVKFLADTLGFRTSFHSKMAAIKTIGYECEVFRVRIYGDIDKIPARIERKKARGWKSPQSWQHTGIEVVYDKIDEYYGFVIDGNHRFLLEDMTVTHNTAFSLSVVRNAAVDFGHPVAFFSLEMSELQLVNRLISAEAELKSDKIKRGNLAEHEWAQLYHKTLKIKEAPIFIDDTPGLSVLELRAKCRRLKAQHDIQLIIVDYLQLMTANVGKGGQGNREQEIALISRSLKNIAKELNIPVIALSQLSRAVETRGGDKRPQLSDLRESGCITGDSLILNNETGELIPIKELAERPTAEPFTCAAIDAQLKVKPHQLVKAFYSGKKPVFELLTRSGRRIKASANHPFLKLNGWTRLDALALGDRIAVPRQISITNPSNPMSEDELILLAHLIGDGCILPKQPYHYTSADQENIEIVKQTSKRLFSIESTVTQQKNWWHVYLRSPYHLTHGVKHPITNWYSKLRLERVRSYHKILPKALFQSDNERVALFLSHLWATDGNISWSMLEGRKDSAAIYYASSSHQLCAQVQHLLLRLGILSSIKTQVSSKGYRDMYHLKVEGADNQIQFLEKIGCFGERGKIIPVLLEALKKISGNPNYDVIPKEAWQAIIRPLKDEQGIGWREFSAKLGTSYSGSNLYKHGISRTRMQHIAQVLPFTVLNQLAESEVLWDEIIEIKALGEEDVYDATVAEVHNFVANDIILHNSIEQDADIVLFLYRPEYYGITQDMEGNPTKDVGEVIIAKHRNGSLDDVKLKFIGEFTKFTNLENDGFNFGGDAPKGMITLSSKINERPSSNTTPPPNTNPLPPTDEPPF